MSSPSITVALRETLALFEDRGVPQTTTEVADCLDLGRRSTYDRLERLVDHGLLETKKVGANGRVWWRSTTESAGDGNGTADRAATSAAGLDGLAGPDAAQQGQQERTTFEMLVDAVEEYAIFILGPDGRVRTWNPGAERIKGYSADDILGEHISTFYTEADRTAGVPERNLSEAANQGSIEDEGWRVRADGSRFWANVTITPLYDDGALAGYAKVTRDMTERREREWTLQTFREAVDAAGHSIYYTDTDGTIEYVNPAFEETTGYSAEEAIGETPRILKSGEHDEEFYEELWTTILAGETWRGEIVNTTKDGERYVVEQTIAPVEDESGNVAHLAAINADITDRKDRERRYDAVFNQTYQFTGLLEPDGTLVEANDSALEFGGLDRATVLGQQVWETYWFQHGDTAQRVRDAVERARDGEFVRQELQVQGTDENTLIDFSIRPVTDENGEISYLIPEGRDISDRVEAERELADHRDQLATLNHLNTVLHTVTGTVIEQSTREEIERTVCDALADADPYDFAWIGDVDSTTQQVTVRAGAGVHHPIPGRERPGDAGNADPMGPAVSASQTGEIEVLDGVEPDSRHDRWRDDIDTPGDTSIAGIPLVHDGTVYGVLAVSATRPNAFEDHEQAVLAQFGAVVGQAIAAAERKQALISDEIVELEYYVPNILEERGIVQSASGRLALETVVATSDGGHLVYGTATPDARETLDALVAEAAHWDSVTVIAETPDTIRFQARLSALPLRSGVGTAGGSIDELVVEDGDITLRIHLPPSADATAITEAIHSSYPTAQLRKKHQIPRPQDSVTQIRQSLYRQLTDRQQAVLEVAYNRGYFEWPRDADGEEISDSLGIASTTFSQHLRKAEKRVFEWVFTLASQSEGGRSEGPA